MGFKLMLVGPYKASTLRIGQFIAPPIGIYRITSYLDNIPNLHVDVFDCDLEGEDKFYEKLKNERYDMIGFSMLQPTLKNDIKLIFKAKKISPKSLLIGGGQGAVFNAKLLLNETPLKIIVRGFGEIAIERLVKKLMLGKKSINDIKNIPSIYIKSRKKIISTPQEKPINIETFRKISLCFDFKKVPYEKYWSFMEGVYTKKCLKIMKNDGLLRTIRLMTSSHCNLKCKFCSSTNFLDDACANKQRVVMLEPDDVLKLMKNAVKAHPNVESLFFNDDDFIQDKKRVIKICDLIQKEFRRRKFNLFCLSRIDRINKSILKKMKETGFKLIIYGVESFSKKVINEMSKKIGFKNYTMFVRKVISDTIESGIIPLMNLIIFYPTTQIDDIETTIENAIDMIRKGARLTTYTYIEVYPGSNILKEDGHSFTTEGFNVDGKKFELPTYILPKEKKVKDLAAKSIDMKKEVIARLKEKYKWEGIQPHPIDGLSLFYSIYKILGKSTKRIENTIDFLMNKEIEKNDDYDGFISDEQRSFPTIVNVCVLRGKCNSNCIHCPVGRLMPAERIQKFGNKNMSLSLFKRIADQIAEYNSTLRIHGVGEPILWNKVEGALKYAKKKSIKTWIFTNAITNNAKLLKTLTRNCSIVEVSVNSFDRWNYRKTKGVDKFDLVMRNIRFMYNIIEKENLNTRLIVSRVESKDEKYDKKFVEFWQSTRLVSDAFIRSYHNYNGLLDNRGVNIRKIVPCLVHWARLNIDYDGKTVICFNELFKSPHSAESLVLGDASKTSINEIWHCEKLDLIRRAQLCKNYKVMKTLPCINCKFCQPMDTKRQTSEIQIKKLEE